MPPHQLPHKIRKRSLLPYKHNPTASHPFLLMDRPDFRVGEFNLEYEGFENSVKMVNMSVGCVCVCVEREREREGERVRERETWYLASKPAEMRMS